MMLLAESIAKSYGKNAVLSGVTFSVAAGELVSIVGPSGEGKSTIARILCGTVRRDAGRIAYQGRALSFDAADRDLRRSIQLIPQQPYASLDPRQTIGKAIVEPLLFHRLTKTKAEARQKACELLEKVLLPPELYHRRPHELSGGQAQRALIARSLTVSPKLLVADEATSMLDVSSQAAIVEVFRQLIGAGDLSVLLISHDHALVEAVSDRVYQLSDGKMIEKDNHKTEAQQ